MQQKLTFFKKPYYHQLSRRKFLEFIAQCTGVALLGCHAVPAKELGRKVDLATQIGQMLVVGFRGLDVMHESPIVQDIRERQIGGVVLFDYDTLQRNPRRNIESPAQVRNLVKQLQSYAQIPLLVTIDYEGGEVNRLKEKFGFPPTVSHAYLGAQDNLDLTFNYATTMAQTLASLGINMNFAPVVDLGTEPNNPIIAKLQRSFSADPQIVTRQAMEFIKAHHVQGVLCTLKHFPGHGSSIQDSHISLPDITSRWTEQELEPYHQLIRSGHVDAIMTGHLFNKRLDPIYPSTLSKSTINHLLRGQLHYDGVVFSDDVQMRAIASQYGLEVAVQKAIEAGVDCIIAGNNTGSFDANIARRIISIIHQLVDSGVISPARIEESYQRIQRLKSRFRTG